MRLDAVILVFWMLSFKPTFYSPLLLSYLHSELKIYKQCTEYCISSVFPSYHYSVSYFGTQCQQVSLCNGDEASRFIEATKQGASCLMPDCPPSHLPTNWYCSIRKENFDDLNDNKKISFFVCAGPFFPPNQTVSSSISILFINNHGISGRPWAIVNSIQLLKLPFSMDHQNQKAITKPREVFTRCSEQGKFRVRADCSHFACLTAFHKLTLPFRKREWKWGRYQSEEPQNAISVLTLESPICLTYWWPIFGGSGSDRSLGLGESSLCWSREGEEDIKSNFSFSTQGICAKVTNVCQQQGIPPSWESRRSLSKLDGKDVFPPMSTQLWRCSISDMYPSPPPKTTMKYSLG